MDTSGCQGTASRMFAEEDSSGLSFIKELHVRENFMKDCESRKIGREKVMC